MTTSAARRLRRKSSLITTRGSRATRISLVSFPEKIIRDLGLKLELRTRTTASFTPYARDGKHNGLLLSNVSEEASRESMRELTGSDREHEQLKRFYNLARVFAEQTWDTMLEPLRSKNEFRRRFDVDEIHRESWRSLAEEPLGRAIERYLRDDLVRGLVFTDAKIGVFTHPHDPTLLQNRCFLYHLIGNKTGEWKVPVGGMGAVAFELERAARQSGAEMMMNVELTRIHVAGSGRTVEFESDGKRQTIEARFLLVNFGRNVLSQISSTTAIKPPPRTKARYSRSTCCCAVCRSLKSTRHDPAEAFRGTFHSDEGYEQMNASYRQASEGQLPDKLPCEVYCHTLTDDSILAPGLRAQGFHTMTLFGLDTPYRLFAKDNNAMRTARRAKLHR